jgi:hypothetical protein
MRSSCPHRHVCHKPTYISLAIAFQGPGDSVTAGHRDSWRDASATDRYPVLFTQPVLTGYALTMARRPMGEWELGRQAVEVERSSKRKTGRNE